MNYIHTIIKDDTIYFIYDKHEWAAWKERARTEGAPYKLVMRKNKVNIYWGFTQGQHMTVSIIDDPIHDQAWMKKMAHLDTITTITPEL